MGRLVSWLLRLLVVLLLLPAGYSFLRESVRFIRAIPGIAPLMWAGLGAISAFVIALLFNEQVLRLLEAMSHEGKHALIALILGHEVTGIEAHANKDSVTYVKYPTYLIYLAPYILPILTLPVLVVRAVLPNFQPMILDVLIGFTFMLHIIELTYTLQRPQKDLKTVGYSLSLAIIILANVIFIVVILAVVLQDLTGLLNYFRRSIMESPAYYRIALDWLRKFWALLEPVTSRIRL